jgi:hypothetical protein
VPNTVFSRWYFFDISKSVNKYIIIIIIHTHNLPTAVLHPSPVTYWTSITDGKFVETPNRNSRKKLIKNSLLLLGRLNTVGTSDPGAVHFMYQVSEEIQSRYFIAILSGRHAMC